MDMRGIEPRGESIRITFSWQGRRCRETLKLPPTPKNRAYAAQLRAEIRRKIALGTFNYADYFPESARLAGHESRRTFFDLARIWIDGQTHLAYSTQKEYRAMLNRYFMPELGDLPIRDITHATLLDVIGRQTWSAKTRNNAITPLKGIFELAYIDGLIQTNPAARIKAAKTQKPEPDPLTLEEVELVLHWMSREPHWHGYFEVAFFTGLRTSELIALQWQDIDFHGRQLRVHRAKVRKREKGTKTSRVRDVELSSRAIAALKRHKALTFMAGEHVFRHPGTGQPIVDDRPPRLFWTAALRAVGIRHRDAYQTRHTCITTWLMAGANPMWAARQAGHATPQMTFNRYARWIARADAGLEMAKVEQKLGSIPRPGTERVAPDDRGADLGQNATDSSRPETTRKS